MQSTSSSSTKPKVYWRDFGNAGDMEALQFIPLRDIRVVKASPTYIPTVPSLRNGQPRINKGAPPQYCYFTQLNTARNRRLGPSSTREAEEKFTQLLRQIVQQSVSLNDIQKLIKAAVLNAKQIEMGKLTYLWELRYYHQPTIQVAEAWKEITLGLALINNELEYPETAYRYCDNSVLLYLLKLLEEIINPQVVNFQEAAENWSENVKLWVCQNYDRYYALRVLAHAPSTRTDFAVAEALQRHQAEERERVPEPAYSDEDPEEAYTQVASTSARAVFDVPLSSEERRQQANLPMSQRAREKARQQTSILGDQPDTSKQYSSYMSDEIQLDNPPPTYSEAMEMETEVSTPRYQFESALPRSSSTINSRRKPSVVTAILQEKDEDDYIDEAWTSSDELPSQSLSGRRSIQTRPIFKAPLPIPNIPDAPQGSKSSIRSSRTHTSTVSKPRSKASYANTARPPPRERW